MITKIPEHWKLEEDLEMLFLFYQCADELLSEYSSDTYMVPLHNAMTLTYEMDMIYDALENYNTIEKYYDNYINVIIDEFLDNIKDDKILKNIIGQRFDSIYNGFEEAKKNPKLLERWINQVHQNCDIEQYINIYKATIIKTITESNNKKDLLSYTKRFFSSLLFVDYTREYLYSTTKRFFDNFNKVIESKSQIKEFMDIFDCEKKKIEYLVLLDLNSIDYLDSISDNLTLSRHIKKVDIKSERNELCKDYKIMDLFKEYDDLSHNEKKYQKIAIVRYDAYALDQFSAIEDFDNYINFIQSFSIYFKHHRLYRQVFKVLFKGDNGRYYELKMPDKLLKRPYIEQKDMDSRIENILRANSLSKGAFLSLTSAITMHSEALDSKNVNTLIKSLWTSLESLFSNLGTNEMKVNVIDSTISIIQKTYLLKILRSLYSQVLESISESDVSELEINSFEKFIYYFSSKQADELKPLYNKVDQNLLLRTRIYNLRKELNNGKQISDFLSRHEVRIKWQLMRIYRTRNLATHLGLEMYYANIIVNHLHNYFDFLINYLLCKVCNGDYVSSISSVIFEARNDNQIHIEHLKSKELLSGSNYKNLLFGPDERLIKYEFEK